MNWDYSQEEEEIQAKHDPAWKLERQIMFGLDGQKFDRQLLAQYLPQLHIPENRRAFFELLLWNKQF